MVSRVRAWLCVLLLPVSGAAVAQPVHGTTVPLWALPGSTLTIRGSTTIGAHWSCVATDINAVAGLDPSAHALTAEAVRTVHVNVLVFALRCQSPAMDRAMRKAMRADRDSNSAIVGTFAARMGRDTHQASDEHLDGALIVAGVIKSVVFDVIGERMSDSVYRVQCSVPLTLSDFKIDPPGTLFGLIRSRDSIAVEVDMRFARRMPTAPSGVKPAR